MWCGLNRQVIFSDARNGCSITIQLHWIIMETGFCLRKYLFHSFLILSNFYIWISGRILTNYFSISEGVMSRRKDPHGYKTLRIRKSATSFEKWGSNGPADCTQLLWRAAFAASKRSRLWRENVSKCVTNSLLYQCLLWQSSLSSTLWESSQNSSHLITRTRVAPIPNCRSISQLSALNWNGCGSHWWGKVPHSIVVHVYGVTSFAEHSEYRTEWEIKYAVITDIISWCTLIQATFLYRQDRKTN
jgi:hypothetical protein